MFDTLFPNPELPITFKVLHTVRYILGTYLVKVKAQFWFI